MISKYTVCSWFALKRQFRVKYFKWVRRHCTLWVLALGLAAPFRTRVTEEGTWCFQYSVGELGHPAVTELYPCQMELQAGPNWPCTSLIRLDPRCCGWLTVGQWLKVRAGCGATQSLQLSVGTEKLNYKPHWRRLKKLIRHFKEWENYS